MVEAMSDRLFRAINLAAVAHDGQNRKGSAVPYFSHICGVLCVLAQLSADEDVLVAGVLHDVIEDAPEITSLAEIEAEFGGRVAQLVAAVTKDDALADWQDRADAYIAKIDESGNDVARIVLADKLHNIRSILTDHAEHGDRLWDRFNSTKQQQQWWYAEVLRVLTRKLDPHPILGEYERLVAQLQEI